MRVLYDAHECVPELIKSFAEKPAIQAFGAIERAYIGDADMVTTVSPQIGRLLRKTYGLATQPKVVTNAPPAERDPGAPDLRAEIGLSGEVPLAVYSGGTAVERGLNTVVRALSRVPDLHLAIVCNPHAPTVADLIRFARARGVLDRMHLTTYVPPSQVTQFLSSATVGLIPRNQGGHLDLSLPTKYREYLHAGLPIVASTNKTMAREIKATGVGEVFKAGDPRSLARRLNRLLADPDSYRRAITPEVVAEHSWEEQQKVLEACYVSLSGRAPSKEGRPDLSGIFQRLPDRRSPRSESARRAIDPTLLTVSLGVGRSNPGFRSQGLADAVSARLGVRAACFAAVEDPARRPDVAVVAAGNLDIPRAAAELVRITTSYTHLLIDGAERLFGGVLGDDVAAEAAVLRRNGLTVGMVVHHDDPQHIAASTGFDGPVFVVRPDLLGTLAPATWLPMAIDTDEEWMATAPSFDGCRPLRVLWAAEPARDLTGQSAEAALEALAAAGVIERVGNHQPAGDEHIAAADIVVDQDYGATAIKAMAAGRVVIGHVRPDVRARIGGDLPIVEASPDSLAEVIRELAQDSEKARRLSEAGRIFATAWHDGRATAEAIVPFLRT